MQAAAMSRTRYMQEHRKMRFEEAFQGWTGGQLTQAGAAMLLGQVRAQFSPPRRALQGRRAGGGLLDKRLSQIFKRRGRLRRSRSARPNVQERLCGLERGALSQPVPRRAARRAQLQLGQNGAAGRRACQDGQAPGQAPHQARTRSTARDDGAPERQHPPLGR